MKKELIFCTLVAIPCTCCLLALDEMKPDVGIDWSHILLIALLPYTGIFYVFGISLSAQAHKNRLGFVRDFVQVLTVIVLIIDATGIILTITSLFPVNNTFEDTFPFWIVVILIIVSILSSINSIKRE